MVKITDRKRDGHWLKGLLALLLAGAIGMTTVTPAQADDFYVTVDAFARTANSPTVDWAVTVHVPGDGSCGCQAQMEVKLADGTVQTLASDTVIASGLIKTYEDQSGFYQAVVGFRVSVSGPGIGLSSPWSTVSDEVPTSSPEAEVVGFDRLGTTIAWELEVTGSVSAVDPKPCVVSASCTLYVLTKKADDTIQQIVPVEHSSSSAGVLIDAGDQFYLDRTLHGSVEGAYQPFEYIKLQFVGSVGQFETEWIATGDEVPIAPLALEVNAFDRAGTTVTWELQATGAGFGPDIHSPCSGSNCILRVQGKLADGEVTDLPVDGHGYLESGVILGAEEQFLLDRELTGDIPSSYQAVEFVRLQLIGYGSQQIQTDWIPTTDSTPSEPLTISLESFDRDIGDITFSVTAEGAGFGPDSANPCYGSACSIYVIGKDAAGVSFYLDLDDHSPSSSGIQLGPDDQFDLSMTIDGSFNAGNRAVEFVKARIIGAGGNQVESEWLATEDQPIVAALGSTSEEFGRDGSTFNWSVIATGAGFGPQVESPCSVTTCRLEVVGKRADNSIVSLPIDGHDYQSNGVTLSPSEQALLTRQISGTLPDAYQQVVSVQLRLTGANNVTVHGDWTPTLDHIPTGPLTLKLTTFQRQNGVVTWAATAVGAALRVETGGPCWGYPACTLTMKGRTIDGNVAMVVDGHGWMSEGVTIDSDEQYLLNREITGTITESSQITDIKLTLSSGSNYLATQWLPVSGDISEGRDWGAAADMLLAYAVPATGAAICTAVFPVGTQTNQSTLNDQHLACLAALNNGSTVRTAVISVMKSAGPGYLSALLLRLGKAAQILTSTVREDIDYDKPLPSGCTWIPHMLAQCVDGEETTTYPPYSSPAPLDPTQEHNEITGGGIDYGPVEAPAAGPFAEATDDEIKETMRRTCVAQISAFVVPADGIATIGSAAGLDSSDCSKKPIFFSGEPFPEATAHDLAAILTHPAWMKLSYMSASEKAIAYDVEWSSWGCGSRPDGLDCDEYPFWSAAEGFPIANPPDLLAIDSGDNRRQGNRLGQFYTDCGLKVGAVGSEEREFLVVPLPAGLAWYGYCGQ